MLTNIKGKYHTKVSMRKGITISRTGELVRSWERSPRRSFSLIS